MAGFLGGNFAARYFVEQRKLTAENPPIAWRSAIAWAWKSANFSHGFC
jgi:hypothetical protein